jgi:hypothetical protein
MGTLKELLNDGSFAVRSDYARDAYAREMVIIGRCASGQHDYIEELMPSHSHGSVGGELIVGTCLHCDARRARFQVSP